MILYACFGLVLLALSCNELKYYRPMPQQAEEVQKVPHFLEGVFFVSESEITSKDSLKQLRKKAERPDYFLTSVFDIPISGEDDAQYIKLEKTGKGELQMSTFISTPVKELQQYPRQIKNDSLDVAWDIAGGILMCKGKQRQATNDTVKWVDVDVRKAVNIIDGHYFFTDNEDITVYSFSKKKVFSLKTDEDSDLAFKKHNNQYFLSIKSKEDSIWQVNVLQPVKSGFLYFYIATGEYFKDNIDRFSQLGKFDPRGERQYTADLSDDAFYQLIADEKLREALYFYPVEKQRKNLAYCFDCRGRFIVCRRNVQNEKGVVRLSVIGCGLSVLCFLFVYRFIGLWVYSLLFINL